MQEPSRVPRVVPPAPYWSINSGFKTSVIVAFLEDGLVIINLIVHLLHIKHISQTCYEKMLHMFVWVCRWSLEEKYYEKVLRMILWQFYIQQSSNFHILPMVSKRVHLATYDEQTSIYNNVA
jgi:hypothetical protein